MSTPSPLANVLHVDPVVPFGDLRKVQSARFAAYATKEKRLPRKRHAVWPA